MSDTEPQVQVEPPKVEPAPTPEQPAPSKYDPRCPKCQRHVPVYVMCSHQGLPLPIAPGKGPVVLIPDRCKSCGYFLFSFTEEPEQVPASQRLWTPGAVDPAKVVIPRA